jgi:hypothetical protein
VGPRTLNRFGSGFVLPSYRNILDPPPEPIPFQPSDISGLQGWLDANDSDTVVTDASGINVLSWANKGDLSGNFDLSGAADVQYKVNTVNGLNVVTFNPMSFMTGTFPLNFQDRSIFIVSRRTNDVSDGVLTFWTSDTTGGMETGIAKSGSDYTYLLAKHPGSGVELAFTTQINTTGKTEMVTLINSSTDLSGNYGGLNGIEQTLIFGALADYNTASFPYFIGNYGNGAPLDNTYDMCEVLVYDRVLSVNERLGAEEYLQRKWRVKVPVPPAPFVPTDISGLQVWLDADDPTTFITVVGVDGERVTDWLDKSGNSRNATQALYDNSPDLSGNGLNFSSVVGQALLLPDFTTVPYTIFIVMNYATTGNTGIALFLNRSGSAAIFRNLYGDSPNPIYQSIGVDYGGSAFRYMAASPGVDDTARHVQTFSLPNSAVGKFYLDGVEGDSSAGFTQSTGTATAITIGAYSQDPTNASLTGTINEILWYNSVLTTAEREDVEAYLYDKWGP